MVLATRIGASRNAAVQDLLAVDADVERRRAAVVVSVPVPIQHRLLVESLVPVGDKRHGRLGRVVPPIGTAADAAVQDLVSINADVERRRAAQAVRIVAVQRRRDVEALVAVVRLDVQGGRDVVGAVVFRTGPVDLAVQRRLELLLAVDAHLHRRRAEQALVDLAIASQREVERLLVVVRGRERGREGVLAGPVERARQRAVEELVVPELEAEGGARRGSVMR